MGRHRTSLSVGSLVGVGCWHMDFDSGRRYVGVEEVV